MAALKLVAPGQTLAVEPQSLYTIRLPAPGVKLSRRAALTDEGTLRLANGVGSVIIKDHRPKVAKPGTVWGLKFTKSWVSGTLPYLQPLRWATVVVRVSGTLNVEVRVRCTQAYTQGIYFGDSNYAFLPSPKLI